MIKLQYLKKIILKLRTNQFKFYKVINGNTISKHKETIIVVTHELSRTGAPILAMNIAKRFSENYNVIVYSLKDGDILEDFITHINQAIVFRQATKFNNRINQIINKIISLSRNALLYKITRAVNKKYKIKFAIVNSIVSAESLSALSNNFIPCLTLIHEFASYVSPKSLMMDTFLLSNSVIFSTNITLQNAKKCSPTLKCLDSHILPQGLCETQNKTLFKKTDENELQILQETFETKTNSKQPIIILGAGSVIYRKGVDIFIEIASLVCSKLSDQPLRFIWIGSGYKEKTGGSYDSYLYDQIQRSKLENKCIFIDSTRNIEYAYKRADIFLLSARLDPLPNVAIDAMHHKKPVVCFDNASGIAEILRLNDLGHCVAPYLNTHEISKILIKLASSTSARKKISEKIYTIAKKIFDQKKYISGIDKIATQMAAKAQNEKTDCEYIYNNSLIKKSFIPKQNNSYSYKQFIRTYVRSWKKNLLAIKPFPGFHPGIYAQYNNTISDPLVHYIKNNKPNGPWKYRVILPIKRSHKTKMNVALHLNLECRKSAIDYIKKININLNHPDLFISVPNQILKDDTIKLLENYSGKVKKIEICRQTKGSIFPLLAFFGKEIIESYDIIGNIHTEKPKEFYNTTSINPYDKFTIENMLGGRRRMVDSILSNYENNKNLGLVFPDDPYAGSLETIETIDKGIKNLYGIPHTNEKYFNFPTNSMFWIRTEALKPLIAQSYDVLQSINCLIPFVTKSKGFTYATTFVPGIRR